jgi:hypothetical protein
MEKINAEVWCIQICDSAVDMAHNFYYSIREVHIPDYDISFNMANNSLNVFKTSKSDRYGKHEKSAPSQISTIVITKDFAELLKTYLDTKAKIQETANGILE